MRQEHFDPLIAVAVLGICAISFMLGAAFAGGLNWKNILDVATAVGTVGAAVVAGWLGVDAARRTRRAALDKASIVAASVLPRLEQAVADLDVFWMIEAPSKEDDDDPSRQFKILCTINQQLKDVLPRLEVPHDSLVALTPLPRRAAARLARGIAVVRSTIDFLEPTVLVTNNWRSRPKNLRRSNVWFAIGSAREAADLCAVAVSECQRLVDIAATHPSKDAAAEGARDVS